MKEVTEVFRAGNELVEAIVLYKDNDLVDSWALKKGRLNLSMLTYKQLKELTGLTEGDILRMNSIVVAGLRERGVLA